MPKSRVEHAIRNIPELCLAVGAALHSAIKAWDRDPWRPKGSHLERGLLDLWPYFCFLLSIGLAKQRLIASKTSTLTVDLFFVFRSDRLLPALFEHVDLRPHLWFSRFPTC